MVKKALDELQEQCKVQNAYSIEEPFTKFGWTFFNLQLSEEIAGVIENSGMMEGALGYRIGEQMTNFVGHYLDERGCNIRIKKLDYG